VSTRLDLLEIIRAAPVYVPVVALSSWTVASMSLRLFAGGDADTFLCKPGKNLLNADVKRSLQRTERTGSLSAGAFLPRMHTTNLETRSLNLHEGKKYLCRGEKRRLSPHTNVQVGLRRADG
jgi:hypothetical protein